MIYRVLSAGLLSSLLVACATTEGQGASSARVVAPEALGATAHAGTTWPDDAWWKSFGDPTLDALIARGLDGNPDLRAAQDRVVRAQASAGIARAGLLPSVDARANSLTQRFSEHDIYPPPLGGDTWSLNSAKLDASWELDFFGRQRAALAAALGQARAADAEAHAARSLLASRIASEYVTLARAIAQRDIARATLEQRERLRVLVADRVKAGLDTTVELRQAEGAVPQTAQDIAALEADVDIARHALAALLGEGPGATADVAPALSAVRVLPTPEALAADLIGRRADIVAARERVDAARAGVDEARAAFYPNVNLAAFVGFESLGFSEWFKAGSRTYGVGPAVSLPLFEGGRLRANLRGRAAEADAAIESYNATLIGAVRDVADAVTQVRSIEQRQVQQRDATRAAESAFELATLRYRAGLGNYLTVLTAEINATNQRRLSADLDAFALQAQVALVRALGGGYVDSASTSSQAGTVPSLATASKDTP